MTGTATSNLKTKPESEEVFELRNDPPKPRKQRFYPQDRDKQLMLLDGLDCLPGQEDLFDLEPIS